MAALPAAFIPAQSILPCCNRPDPVANILHGKAVVLTGAGQGLGRALARQLANAGSRVGLIGRTEAKLRAVQDEIGASHPVLTVDITDQQAVKAAFAQAAEQLGGIDALINNAALFQLSRLVDMPQKLMLESVSTNLLAPLYCIQEAVPFMRQKGHGDIISISSESVAFPFPHLGFYAATKAALETMSQALGDELRPDNIRVCVVRSGTLANSQINDYSWSEQAVAAFKADLNHKGIDIFARARMEPEAVANAIVQVLETPRDAFVETMTVRAY
ncbi:MAG: SDR family oxidoreductase [Sphingorhabdus sp.]